MPRYDQVRLPIAGFKRSRSLFDSPRLRAEFSRSWALNTRDVRERRELPNEGSAIGRETRQETTNATRLRSRGMTYRPVYRRYIYLNIRVFILLNKQNIKNNQGKISLRV